MEWFKHDIGAFRDEKIQALRIDCGGAAVDAYYAIIELIYEGETVLTLGKNQAETKSVLHGLCLGWDGFLKYVDAMRNNDLLSVEYRYEGDEVTMVTLDSRRASAVIANMNRLAEVARQNGKSGGRPKKKNPAKTQTKPSDNPAKTQTKPRAPKTNKTIKTIEKEVPKGTSKKKPFAKPTAAEVYAYARSRGASSFDAEKFIDYYESNGWKVGRNPMKDWKAAVRNWIRNDSPKEAKLDEHWAKYD